MTKEKTFMQHICKTCGKIFLAEDLYRRMTPEDFRNCEDCEADGAEIIREDVKNTKMVRKKQPKN